MDKEELIKENIEMYEEWTQRDLKILTNLEKNLNYFRSRIKQLNKELKQCQSEELFEDNKTVSNTKTGF